MLYLNFSIITLIFPSERLIKALHVIIQRFLIHSGKKLHDSEIHFYHHKEYIL